MISEGRAPSNRKLSNRRPDNKPRRKKPAYPKPGTGEDFPARRPGTKVAEGKRGRQIKQSTRATQTRARLARKSPFRAYTPSTRMTYKAKGYTAPRKGPLTRRPGPGQPLARWPFSHDVRGKPTREEPWPL